MFKAVTEDFLSLIYPNNCISCNNILFKHEKDICLKCTYSLPRTQFESRHDNFVAQLFWGKAPVKYATSHYFFYKDGILQRLMHSLKYKGKKMVGTQLGILIGQDLKDSAFASADVVIPIPMHPKKMKKRGYNQAEIIAEGIAAQLNKPLDVSSLIKTKNSSTQTRKGTFERWKNVKSVFETHPEQLENKHILLVDDVITTGSTMQAAINTLTQNASCEVSVATAAIAWR